MLEAIDQQIAVRWEFDEAVKPENQKLFPFSIFSNFNANRNYPDKIYEPLHCSYCKDPLLSSEGYGSYYTAYIVFESKDDVRVCCSLRQCRPQPKPYEYSEQIHGYPNPIILPDELQKSIKHLAVARCFFRSSHFYALNRYLKTGITWKQIEALTSPSSHQGGSDILSKFGWIGCGWEWNGTHLTTDGVTTDGGEIIKLTKSQIVDIVNEILEANRTEVHQQLCLF